MSRILNKHGLPIEYADATCFTPGIIDVHRKLKTKDATKVKDNLIVKASYGEEKGSTFQECLDISTWLPYAAKALCISSDISDYIFVPIFTIPSGLPNRNGVAFPLPSLLAWNTEHGQQAYRTFKGKPAHLEHANDDPSKAYGVIADVSLRKLVGFSNGKVWKLLELIAIDRSKHADIAEDVLSGKRNSFSMGALVGSYSCSYCGLEMGKCNHITPKPGSVDFYAKDGILVCKNVHDIIGFETSIVKIPAYSTALNDKLMIMRE